MARKVTISDVAREAGVSKSTVSFILNGSPAAKRMSEETCARVHSIAQRMDYHPSMVARSLFNGKTSSLGLVVGDINTPYYAELASTALEIAEKRGKQLLVSVTQWNPGKELQCLSGLMQRNIDGVIFCTNALKPGSEIYEKIVKQHYPIVLYSSMAEGVSTVCSDHEPGMIEALTLLRGNGHSKVAFVDVYRDLDGKQLAFEKTCRDFQIEPVLIFEDAKEKWEEKTFAKIQRIAADVKAFIVSADHLGLRLLGYLNSQGRRVPEEIDLISIDGTIWGAYGFPALTSIKQDISGLMEKAIDMLNKPPKKPQVVKVPTKLLIRESVKLDQVKIS